MGLLSSISDALSNFADRMQDAMMGEHDHDDAADYAASQNQAILDHYTKLSGVDGRWHGSITRSDRDVSLTIRQADNVGDSDTLTIVASSGSRPVINWNGTVSDNAYFGSRVRDVADGGAGNDILVGGNGNDSLSGGTGSDRLVGGDGNDTLVGGAGSDRIFGGLGSDTLRFGSGDAGRGGTGADHVVIGSGATGVRVLGHSAWEDDIDVTGAVRTLGGGGWTATKDGNDWVIDGSGWYEFRDGSGATFRVDIEGSPRWADTYADAQAMIAKPGILGLGMQDPWLEFV